MRSKIQRVLAAACVTAAAVVIPVATAGPAQATPIQCMHYIESKGYIVGPNVRSACHFGDDFPMGFNNCMAAFTILGVKSNHRLEACNRAAR